MLYWYLDTHRPKDNEHGFAIYHELQHFLAKDVLASQSNHQNQLRYKHVNFAHTIDINEQTEHLPAFHKCYVLVQAKSDRFSNLKSFSLLWQ